MRTGNASLWLSRFEPGDASVPALLAADEPDHAIEDHHNDEDRQGRNADYRLIIHAASALRLSKVMILLATQTHNQPMVLSTA
jgi:hypothetical protein